VSRIPDAATKQIAQINKLVAQSTPTNQYLAHRIFQTLPSVPPTDHLFKVQHDLVQQNKTALDLLLFKYPGVADSTKRELKEYPMPTLDNAGNSLSAANAAAQAQCQLGKLGLKSILPLLEKRPLDVGLALTVVQLYVVTKNHGAAIKVMESLFKRLEEAQTDDAQEVRFAPGVVAVLVSLYSIEGQKSHIRRELAKAATFWRHRSKTHSAFFRATGLSLLQSGKQEDLKEAQGIFAALRETNPNDSTANAGFVAAFAITDPTKVTEPANKLTPIEKLTAGIDATALDQAGVPVPPSAAAAQAASRKRAAEAAAKPPKKRVRQSRQPKDLDPKKKPDPERWLPLRDRSTYKPKGKKGKQKQAALTQGGISKDAADSGAEAKAEVSKGGGSGGGKSKKKGKKK
jgi:signal recognition particle subunit SRP72